MEERLRSLFEYQRFEGNERLSGMLDDAMKRFEAGMQGELSDDDVMTLLHQKWILPLVDGLSKLPESIIADFTAKLEKLALKYSTTFAEVEDQIVETERELSQMINSLTGDEYDMQGLNELKKMLGGM